MFRAHAWTVGFLIALVAVHGASAWTLDIDGLLDPRYQEVEDQQNDASHDGDEAAETAADEADDAREEATREVPDPATAPDSADAARQDALAFLADMMDAAQTVVGDATAKLEGLQGDVEVAASGLEDDLGVLADDEETPVDSDASYEPQTKGGIQEISVQAAILMAAGTTAASVALLWIVGSSGMAGAGSASGAGGLSGADALRRGALFSPMFTRFERESVMQHPNRMQLYTLVSTTPGIRLQDLCDETGLSRTAVTHHLRLLEQQHVIVSRRMGRSRHYYENGGRYERDQKDAYALLQNDRSREIADYIRTHPGTIQKQLCEALGVRASIAHWHVKRLEEANLVDATRQGRTVHYFPGDGMAELRF